PFPKNLHTGKAYRGINVLLLWPDQFPTPYWITFKQAQERGGHVKKGEKGMPVIFYKVTEKKEEQEQSAETSDRRRSFILRYSTAFNVEQCEGLEVPRPDVSLPEVPVIERCEQIISNWTGRPALKLDNPYEAQAYYRREADEIHMPERNRFSSPEAYYAALFHECIHAAGAPHRLNREKGKSFGDEQYSREELIAEMGAAFLCAIVGIDNRKVQDNNAAYLQNWIKALKGDSRLIVQAASEAQKAVDLILGTAPAAPEEAASEDDVAMAA
ncbi:MAG: zincin-like metallopeptidase domain-containing protein, partial [Acidobacteriaceae bacterium]|nr:zincin-like metallopeptidase domain-containing protein [Acidobacteriaceae bacterium]